MNFFSLLEKYISSDEASLIRSMYILGPYPSINFFKNLKNSNIKPDNIILFYDYRVNDIRINNIKNIFKNIKVYPVSAYTTSKLVHAKLYYMTISRGNNKSILISGSGNASSNAFTFDDDMYTNAESYIVSHIESTKRNKLENYFNDLIQNEYVGDLEFDIDNRSTLYLPSLKQYCANTDTHMQNNLNTNYTQENNLGVIEQQALDLYSWINQGYLVYEYTKKYNLGSIQFNLKRNNDRKILKILTELNLNITKDISSALSISHKFIDKDDLKTENDINQRIMWKGQYSLETFFGHWVPQEFISIVRDEQISNQVTYNDKIIEKILSFTESDIIKECNKLLNKLQLLDKKLRELLNDEYDPEDYFNIKNNYIDIDSYKTLFYNQIKTQQTKCKNEYFRERFSKKYMISSVQVVDNVIDDLVYDVCESIDTTASLSRIVNKIVTAFNKTIQDITICSSSYNILNDKERFMKFYNNLIQVDELS